MKIIKYIFLTIWTLGCFVGILKNFSHYGFADWVTILIFSILPYIIIGILSSKRKRKVENNNKRNTDITVEKKKTSLQDINQLTENRQVVNEPKRILLNEYTQIESSDVDNNEFSLSNSTQTVSDDYDKQQIAYIETANTIYHTDGKPISDEEVPYLIQAGYENTISVEQHSKNPKFHRTEREENLSFNFIAKYGSQVDDLTEKFESAYRKAHKTNNLDERILLLNESIKSFENAKKFCYSKGKGGTIYFQDTWEYLHNSQNECFSYLNNIEDSLEECIFQRDIAIPGIINIITQSPGILQKNIYKLLPDIDKSTIQYTIKLLESQNKISRIKKGNSYELRISE